MPTWWQAASQTSQKHKLSTESAPWEDNKVVTTQEQDKVEDTRGTKEAQRERSVGGQREEQPLDKKMEALIVWEATK